MSKASLPPETRAERFTVHVLVGFAVVVGAVLLIASIRGVGMDGASLVPLMLAATRAVFGVADRLSRWKA